MCLINLPKIYKKFPAHRTPADHVLALVFALYNLSVSHPGQSKCDYTGIIFTLLRNNQIKNKKLDVPMALLQSINNQTKGNGRLGEWSIKRMAYLRIIYSDFRRVLEWKIWILGVLEKNRMGGMEIERFADVEYL